MASAQVYLKFSESLVNNSPSYTHSKCYSPLVHPAYPPASSTFTYQCNLPQVAEGNKNAYTKLQVILSHDCQLTTHQFRCNLSTTSEYLIVQVGEGRPAKRSACCCRQMAAHFSTIKSWSNKPFTHVMNYVLHKLYSEEVYKYMSIIKMYLHAYYTGDKYL